MAKVSTSGEWMFHFNLCSKIKLRNSVNGINSLHTSFMLRSVRIDRILQKVRNFKK